MQRCRWVTEDEIYKRYHDEEWGVPNFSDRYLFEKICLEGQQAGLSWLTILKRRENYRKAFANFDPSIVAEYTEEDIARLLQNEGLIRYDKKLQSIVNNAQAALRVTADGTSFSDYIWKIVGGKPITAVRESGKPLTQNAESKELSKMLKADGFSFVGPTTMYAFMQAVGMINDHDEACFRYKEVEAIQNEIYE